MLSLRLFGGLALAGPDGPVTGRATQRRRLALLAVLAVARGRPLTRDKLVALLWPDADSERARHGLADSLYVLRDALGEDIILATGDVLSLNAACVTSDVMEFEDALERGDRTRAASLYEAGGPFLDGVHLSDAGELERWIESVRTRLANSYREVLEALANEASARGDDGAAVAWWRKLAADDRLGSRIALGLMRALAAGGDRAGALEFFRVHESVVRVELESAPDTAVIAFAEELRASRHAVPARVDPPRASASVSPVVDDENGAPRAVPSAPVASRAIIADPARARTRRVLWFAPVILLLAAAVYVTMRARPSAADARAVPLIALRPLSNLSTDPKNQSFVDGMTEELITALAKLEGMSVMTIRGEDTDARRVADSRHVSYFLEGGLQLIDERIRLNIQLVDARTGRALWAEKYDSTMSDVFAVQDNIGRSVANALELRLLNGRRGGRLVRHMTSDPVAYELYVRGRDPTLLRSESGEYAGIKYFSQAIARDSTFAAAYAELSHAYGSLARGGGALPRAVLIDSAERAARKAMSLDDSLAAGHTFLAFAELAKQDFRAASIEVNRALELDAHDLFARTLLAVLYNWSGRHDDAVAENRRIVDADPSSLARADLAQALFFAGHDDEALAELQALREVRPPINRMPQLTSEIYLNKKMWKQAVDAFRGSADQRPPKRAALGLARAKSGDRDGALQILQELKERQYSGSGTAFNVAVVYVGLDDYDQAFVWLNRAIDDHSVPFTIMDPTFAQLRKDRRFAAFRRRLGVDDIRAK